MANTIKMAAKKNGKRVNAYRINPASAMLTQLLMEGAIRKVSDDTYELFSQEAVNGKGEIAHTGDYFKVDTKDGRHYPYPNDKEWFERNHRHIEGDVYEQIPQPLQYCEADDLDGPELSWLVAQGKLTINLEDEGKFFNAFLWGAPLSAAKDAVVMFYDVKRDGDGEIVDIDFNLIAREEFEKSYVRA